MSAHDKLSLTAKLIPIIAPFIAVADLRYYLCGINVRPHKDGGAIICATNGRGLALIYDRAGKCDEEVTLRIDPATVSACASKPNSKRELIMRNGRVTVIDEFNQEACIQPGNPVIDHTAYPKYQKLIPKNEILQPGLIGVYSRNVMDLAHKAASASIKLKSRNDSGALGMMFFNENGDPSKSAIVRLGACEDFVAVLMPMRGDVLHDAAPEWAGLAPEIGAVSGEVEP